MQRCAENFKQNSHYLSWPLARRCKWARPIILLSLLLSPHFCLQQIKGCAYHARCSLAPLKRNVSNVSRHQEKIKAPTWEKYAAPNATAKDFQTKGCAALCARCPLPPWWLRTSKQRRVELELRSGGWGVRLSLRSPEPQLIHNQPKQLFSIGSLIASQRSVPPHFFKPLEIIIICSFRVISAIRAYLFNFLGRYETWRQLGQVSSENA